MGIVNSSLRALAGIGLVVAAFLALTAASSSAAKSEKVYWIDLGGTASQHPDYVFFTANSGGFMENIKWKNWGEKKTVGRGDFGTTAPCNGQPCPEGPAKLELRKPVKCTPEFGEKEGKKVQVYRHAKLTYPDGSGKKITTDVTDRSGWTTCKESG